MFGSSLNAVSLLLWLISLLPFASSSYGDGSDVFQTCTQRCVELSCRVKDTLESSPFDLDQPYYMRLLGWDCLNECRYECMWHTVEVFQQVYKYEVPQFYGKWPFVRYLGMQEPLSVLASILNLAANYYMLRKMKRSYMSKEKQSPMRQVYNFSGLVCMNTWVWSAIFHTKDTNFTEKMDYFCAFALTLSQLNLFFIRFFYVRSSRTAQAILRALILASCVYYTYHIYYLGFVRFDYGYNMQANIAVGLINSICWIAWSYHGYFRLRREYVWRCAASVFLMVSLMVFEVFDFSPIFWVADSHALWHLSTTVIPFYWYQFLIDDIYYLENYEKLY
jgi:hypothetical protein